ncbi:MAG: hypothetical protein OXI07_03765 [Gammaproteobacteria bacterium]|nr:hypothetical protein [Gammaproteobacteria bacterium]
MKIAIRRACAIFLVLVTASALADSEGLGVSRDDVLAIFQGTGIQMPDPETRGSLFESNPDKPHARVSIRNQGYPRLDVPKTTIYMNGPRQDLNEVGLTVEASTPAINIESGKIIILLLGRVLDWEEGRAGDWLIKKLDQPAPCLEDNYEAVSSRIELGFSKCQWDTDSGDITILIRRRPDNE